MATKTVQQTTPTLAVLPPAIPGRNYSEAARVLSDAVDEAVYRLAVAIEMMEAINEPTTRFATGGWEHAVMREQLEKIMAQLKQGMEKADEATS
jgi:hypothetical protein